MLMILTVADPYTSFFEAITRRLVSAVEQGEATLSLPLVSSMCKKLYGKVCAVSQRVGKKQCPENVVDRKKFWSEHTRRYFAMNYRRIANSDC
jgi:hypothetical protein